MRLDYQFHHRFRCSKVSNLDYHLHAQGEVELVVMLQGSCRVTCGSRADVIRAGDIFCVFPNQPHKYEASTDVQAYLLIVPVKRYLSAYGNLLQKQLPTDPICRREHLDPALLALLESAYLDKRYASEPMMQGYMMVIFGKILEYFELTEQKTGSEESLRRVLKYINEHYREAVSRKQIAKAVGYNESYISHLFSETMQTTLTDYVHSLRVEDACRLLTETDVSVIQIGFDLGFASVRNFNRVFLKRTGMTPKQYQETKKEK